jgi:hypothetical protein
MAIDVDTIDTAITTIQTTGQSVSVEGMSYSAANLGDLIKLRSILKNENMRTVGNRPVMRGFDFTNMGY